MSSRPRGSYRGRSSRGRQQAQKFSGFRTSTPPVVPPGPLLTCEAGRAVTAYAAEDSAHERSFSVMSWNVLADRLVSNHVSYALPYISSIVLAN
jgi:hypothetical protein